MVRISHDYLDLYCNAMMCVSLCAFTKCETSSSKDHIYRRVMKNWPFSISLQLLQGQRNAMINLITLYYIYFVG
jgi:hypothetical protein